MTITIVDVGMGNVGSVAKMLAKVGATPVRTSDPADVAAASKLVLPGVGAFDMAMERLEQAGLVTVLGEQVRDAGTPILGICLGMQLLAERSEEGERPGLGWIPGEVVRLSGQGAEGPLPVPHMAWNTIEPTRADPLLAPLDDESRFYFVHSYAFAPADEHDALARTHYGEPFVSVVQRENIWGVQFHPEKSHRHGMALMNAFCEI